MSLKIMVLFDKLKIPDSFSVKVKETGAELSFIDCKTEHEKILACRDADWIIANVRVNTFSRKIIEQLDKCKFIETTGVGYEGVDIQAATDHGIGVIRNADLCSEELSDHAMGLILSCSRQIVRLHGIAKSGQSIARGDPEVIKRTGILRGKTLGLIGFGRSGRAMVPKAQGFGMRVLAYDPYVNDLKAKKLKVEQVKFDRLIEESDVISIHADLNPETKYLIGLKEFKKMKPGVIIVNTARGPIIKGADLYIALSEGYIHGAGLDVTEPDPLPPDSPLLKLDNLIVTGHNAGNSPGAWSRMWSFPVTQITSAISKEWPSGLVNPQVKGKYVSKWGLMSENREK